MPLALLGGRWSGVENGSVMACWQDFVAWPALWKAAILSLWVAFCLPLRRRWEPFFQCRGCAENRGARAPPQPHQESLPKKRALCSSRIETEKNTHLSTAQTTRTVHTLWLLLAWQVINRYHALYTPPLFIWTQHGTLAPYQMSHQPVKVFLSSFITGLVHPKMKMSFANPHNIVKLVWLSEGHKRGRFQ